MGELRNTEIDCWFFSRMIANLQQAGQLPPPPGKQHVRSFSGSRTHAPAVMNVVSNEPTAPSNQVNIESVFLQVQASLEESWGDKNTMPHFLESMNGEWSRIL